MPSQSDNSPQRNKLATVLRHALACMVSFALTTQPLYALPTDGVVAGGQATISAAGKELNVTQGTDRAVIDWKGFDIAADERATFNQPSVNSVTLNRVTGGQSASQILGRLEANGNFMIVNSNGVLFGKDAQVNVGGLVATSSDIDNTRFMNGDFAFDKAGNPDSEINNAGSIEVREGGLVGLVAPNVTNTGHIRAKLGKVQLSSGDTFAVDLYGDGLIKVEASDALKKQLVKNSGKISADGGEVLMSTAAAKNAVNGVINMDGIIEAKSVGAKNGKVTLYAEGRNAVKGNVATNKGIKTGKSTAILSGKIDVTGDTGGQVNVFADQVGIFDGAIVDASGKFGGGAIHIGGNYLGQGERPAATRTIVQNNTNILANATEIGNGGTVIVWADDSTDFYGNIQAKGGVFGGNGGFVETSGKNILSGDGYVDASALLGVSGTWLLDPTDITIGATGATVTNGSPNFTSSVGNGTVTASSITSVLGNNTSVIIATGAAGAQAGNITVASNISKGSNSAATLTLNAHNNIIVNDGVSINTSNSGVNNRLSLVFNAAGGSITIGTGAVLDTNGGNATFTAATGIIINGTVSVDAGTFVGSTTLGNFTIGSAGSVVSTATTGTGVTLAASNGNFINNNGVGAVSVGTGSRYLIYSKSAAANVNNGVTSAFKRYNCMYGLACAAFPATGNGFIYRDAAPTLTATPSAIVVTYGDYFVQSVVGYSYTLSGYEPGDAALDTVTGTLNGSTTYFSYFLAGNSPIGNYNINYVSGTLTSALGYGFTYANNPTAITVNKRTASIGLGFGTSISKAYDGNTNADPSGLFVGNVTNGDVFTVSATYTSATYDTKDAGTGKTVTISGFGLTGAGSSNYQLAPENTSLVTDIGEITKRDLNVSFNENGNLFKEYDGNSTAAIALLDNRVAGEVFNVTYTSADFINQATGLADKNAGSNRLITVSGLAIDASDVAKNYNLPSTTFTGLRDDHFISPRALTATITGGTRVYDGTGNVPLVINDDRIAGDVFGYTHTPVSYGTGNVGTYNVVINDLATDGSVAANNYYLTFSQVFGTGTITKRDLIVTATGSNKVYDGNTTALVTLTDDRIAGDVFTDTFAAANYSDKNVANGKTITVTGISIGTSTAANNYNLTSTTATTTGNITKRDLIVGATASNKVYDGNTSAVATLNDNRVAGDVFGVNSGSASFDNKNAGIGKTVTVNGINMAGPPPPMMIMIPGPGGAPVPVPGPIFPYDGNNYNLVNTTTTTTANITQRELFVSVNAQDKVYDGNTDAVVTFLPDNRIAGDIFNTGFASAVFDTKNVGGRLVTTSGINIFNPIGGGDAGNYFVSSTTSFNKASITPRDLIVGATGQDKGYDGNTNAVVTLNDNRVVGDLITVTSTGAGFVDKNAGNNKNVNVVGISLLGAGAPPGEGGFGDRRFEEVPNPASNYRLVNTTAVTTANITPVALAVAGNNQAILSGDALPNLTFTFGSFINGETDSLFSGALATVSPNSPAGTYNITQGTLSAGSNYAIAYTNGLLTITSNDPVVPPTPPQQGPNVPANQVNSANQQGQNPGSDPFNPNQGQNGTLLSLFTGGGGNNNNPADLNNINPAGGGDEGEDLNAINPAAGGNNNGNTIPLIECTPFEPCDVAQ